MHLERCRDQGPATLEDFYGRFQEGARPAAQGMLALMARLRTWPDERRVWGLSSHFRLCLLAEDTYRSPWYVIVNCIAVSSSVEYSIEYLMPSTEAPWPGAYVRGAAHSEDEAVRMILVAMDRSGGWRQAGAA